MSAKDALLLGDPKRGRVIENGVDLVRFAPRGESGGGKLLFIGSFRHFPNVTAYRFLVERIWPLLVQRLPHASLTCIAGPDYRLHWADLTGEREPAPIPGVRLLGFVEDVRPAYAETNIVVVPTTVSAGTNVKVLEAMAMERAVVSTTSGCAGLGLQDGKTVCIADEPHQFADAAVRLLEKLRLPLTNGAQRHANMSSCTSDGRPWGTNNAPSTESSLLLRVLLRRLRSGRVSWIGGLNGIGWIDWCTRRNRECLGPHRIGIGWVSWIHRNGSSVRSRSLAPVCRTLISRTLRL